MQGYKTIVFSVATIALGILQTAGVTDFIAQHPGGFAIGIGALTAVLRYITTSAIFTQGDK